MGDEDAHPDASLAAPPAVGVAEVRPPQVRNGFEADLLDQVQAALTATDVEGRITHWNRRAEGLFGWPAEEALGRDFRDLLVAPGNLATANAIQHRVLSGSTWEGELPIARKVGRPLPSYTTFSPIRDHAGRVSGIVGVSVDISDRVRQERLLAARTAVTHTLAEAADLAEATPAMMAAVCQNLGWEVGALWRVDDAAGVLRCVDVWHEPDRGAVEFENGTKESIFPPGIGLPGRIWEQGRPAWIPDVMKDSNFPRAPSAAQGGLHGAVGFPILLGGTVLGAMEFFSREIREPDDAIIQTMSVIGSQIGQFMRRLAAQESLRQSSERLRLALEAQRFLAEGGAVLASSLDYEETLKRVAQLAVASVGGIPLADWCAVHIRDEDGTVRTLAVEHVDPSRMALAEEYSRKYPQDPRAETGVAEVIRSGRPIIYPDITDELLVQAAANEEHLGVLRGLGMRSVLIVPMSVSGRTLGAITFVSAESGRRYGQEDLAFLEDLARRAALAVENSRLFESKKQVAQKLQAGLLPPELPEIPNVELAGRYRWGGQGSEIGGDFYDAFSAGDGSWGLVIGDVCGKGAEAAVVTGLARYTIRAVALQETKPSRVLAALNEAVRQQRSDRTFCTVSYVRLRQGDRGARLTLCCAGHPLPIVLRADGTIERAGEPGTLLGIFADPELTDRVVDLHPGDALVLYTDGVVEERAKGALFGSERLESVIRSAGGLDAQGIAQAIEHAVVNFRPEALRDDVAILVMRVRP